MIAPSGILTLNILTVWLLAEVYYMPPQGFHGSPRFVAISYAVWFTAIFLMAINTTLWVWDNLQLWTANE